MVSISEGRWLALLFSLYALLALGYSLLMPLWEAPDEPAHYHLALHLARPQVYSSIEHNYEADQPRVYYYAASLVIRALDRIDPGLADYVLPFEHTQNIRKPERRFDWNADNYRFIAGVYLLRWINILFGGLALWLSWLAFREIAPGEADLRLTALALAALTPQFLHIMSSVSNDALGTLAGALLFYLTTQSLKRRSKALDLASILLALILPLATKLSVLPAGLAVLIVIARKWVRDLQAKQWWLTAGLALLGGMAVFSVVFPDASRSIVSEIEWRLFGFRENAFTQKYLTFILGQISETFWGKVGWLAIGLPPWTVGLLTVSWITGAFLTLAALLKTRGKLPQSHLWAAACLVAFFTLAAVVRNGLSTRASQGRLLFPAMGPLMMLMAGGWYHVLPGRLQQMLLPMVVSFMAGVNILLWTTGILPAYYQPFLD